MGLPELAVPVLAIDLGTINVKVLLIRCRFRAV